MAPSSRNLVTGRQLRAARALAGMTQRDLASAIGVNERQIRFWERRRDQAPTTPANLERIELALRQHGVIVFAEPTVGVRRSKDPTPRG